MTVTRDTRPFFDASGLVAAAHSPTGGSTLLHRACQAGAFCAQLTSAVVLESYNAPRGSQKEPLERLFRLLVEVPWELLPVPARPVLDTYLSYIDAKNVHVLAAAVEGGSEFLLTLDRRHILAAADAVEKASFGIVILRPGDFIRQYYSQHEEYSSLPPRREPIG